MKAIEYEKKWESALVLSRVSGFVIDSFSGRQGLLTGNAPAIIMEDVSGGIVSDSHAPVGTRSFLHLKGEASKDIRLKNNRLHRAGKEITFENSSLEK